MSHRINVIIEDDMWRGFEKVPPGERSRTINSALRKWVLRRQRMDAAAEMDQLYEEPGARAISTEEMVRWLREDRDSVH